MRGTELRPRPDRFSVGAIFVRPLRAGMMALGWDGLFEADSDELAEAGGLDAEDVDLAVASHLIDDFPLG